MTIDLYFGKKMNLISKVSKGQTDKRLYLGLLWRSDVARRNLRMFGSEQFKIQNDLR